MATVSIPWNPFVRWQQQSGHFHPLPASIVLTRHTQPINIISPVASANSRHGVLVVVASLKKRLHAAFSSGFVPAPERLVSSIGPGNVPHASGASIPSLFNANINSSAFFRN
jgi:tripartite-type tricarboxylate transporter receptor subunit TctC